MGFLRPQSDSAEILGMDCFKDSSEIKKAVGYIPGEIAFPDAPTRMEFLKRQAELLGLSDMSYAETIIKKLQLDPTANLKRMLSHMFEEVEGTCDKVAHIKDGKIIAVNSY
jgi:ABC-2 type transport system ATP-binding protein